MATDVTREEFKHLETRVDIIERVVEGEKMVTRHILEQTRRNGDDLAAIKSRLDRGDQRFDGLERRFDGLERKVDGVERKVDGLTKDLPKIIGEVMRDVLRERDKKR
jgi:tetrahydromethanopterin S-methyltransferase subunit G